jgi:hypothetical protein
LKKNRYKLKAQETYSTKVITENFPNLKEKMPIQVQEALRTSNRHNQNRTSPWHILVKTLSTENKERILKSAREKSQVTYKDKPIRITDFTTETLKVGNARRSISITERK